MTVTQSVDLLVPVQQEPDFDAASLTEALAGFGLRVELPAQLRIDSEDRYIPVRVWLEDGRVVHTGIAILWEPHEAPDADEAVEDEDQEDLEDQNEDLEDDDQEDLEDENEELEDDDQEDLEDENEELEDEDERRYIDNEVGVVRIWAMNAPMPTDANEGPLGYYMAAAIARLGAGMVVILAEAGDPMEPEAMLETYLPTFDPSLPPAWNAYPYDLFLAAEDGDAAAIGPELARGAHLEARTNKGLTPLMVALSYQSPAAAWELLRHGANARAVNGYGKTTEQYASDCFDIWVAAEVARRAIHPTDALFAFIAAGDADGLQAALDQGVPVEATSPEGLTLLVAATRRGDEAMVQLLLARGVDPNRPTPEGETALAIAERNQHVAAVKVLMAHGARRSFSR
jgi:hypothetical protein